MVAVTRIPMPCHECDDEFDRDPEDDGYFAEILRHHRHEHDHFRNIDLDID
jgi:hypothetical protein